MTHSGSEQTKIVPVICRDCKETMTILAYASARIIEGRCPGCTKAFNKKGEEYNKSIGYTPEPEKLSDLAIHTLACNAGFGLEWLLHGEAGDRTVRLLQDGIRFCDNIVETVESKTFKNSLQKTVTALNDHVNELQGDKTGSIGYKSPYSEQDIRRMQHFFNEKSTPYLRRRLAIMRRRQHGYGW